MRNRQYRLPAIIYRRLTTARFAAAKRPNTNLVQTVNWVTSLVALLENTRKLEFYSWMDEMSLPEIPEWIIVSYILEFALLAEQICLAKTAFAVLAAATFTG